MIAFDLVFLARMPSLSSELKAARAALDRVSSLGPSLPGPVRPMVEARRALLAALRGNHRAAQAACEASKEASGESIPHLDAWNRLFLGWHHRLLGNGEQAREELSRALAFFSAGEDPLRRKSSPSSSLFERT